MFLDARWGVRGLEKGCWLALAGLDQPPGGEVWSALKAVMVTPLGDRHHVCENYHTQRKNHMNTWQGIPHWLWDNNFVIAENGKLHK